MAFSPTVIWLFEPSKRQYSKPIDIRIIVVEERHDKTDRVAFFRRTMADEEGDSRDQQVHAGR